MTGIKHKLSFFSAYCKSSPDSVNSSFDSGGVFLWELEKCVLRFEVDSGNWICQGAAVRLNISLDQELIITGRNDVMFSMPAIKGDIRIDILSGFVDNSHSLNILRTLYHYILFIFTIYTKLISFYKINTIYFFPK